MPKENPPFGGFLVVVLNFLETKKTLVASRHCVVAFVALRSRFAALRSHAYRRQGLFLAVYFETTTIAVRKIVSPNIYPGCISSIIIFDFLSGHSIT